MRFPFLKPKRFEPDFPIIPLYATESEARAMLTNHAEVIDEEAEPNSPIAQRMLLADNNDTRIAVGLWDGRVRYTNYLTERFNENDDMKGRKLGWFLEYYGGAEEFDEPVDTGYMIFWRNPKKKLRIVFGLHCGPVRIIDEDPEHWPDTINQEEAEQGRDGNADEAV
jgi:hypothetical protein